MRRPRADREEKRVIRANDASACRSIEQEPLDIFDPN
jgi:hypothetical protein